MNIALYNSENRKEMKHTDVFRSIHTPAFYGSLNREFLICVNVS